MHTDEHDSPRPGGAPAGGPKLFLTVLGAVVVISLAGAIAPVRSAIGTLSWELVVFACLTIGLAPFTPPHLVEKLRMLRDGTLERPLDWFDLALHATPWLLLLCKVEIAILQGLPA